MPFFYSYSHFVSIVQRSVAGIKDYVGIKVFCNLPYVNAPPLKCSQTLHKAQGTPAPPK